MNKILLALVVVPTLMAQSAEFGIHGGQSRLSESSIGDIPQAGGAPIRITLTDGFRLGFRVTLNNWRFFGHEFGYAYNRTQLRFETTPPQEQGMAIHQGFYNFLVYATPEGSTIRPFATGGGHFSNFTPPGTSATSGGGDLKFGVNYGGGIKVRVAPMFAIRFDLRQYLTPKPFELQNQSGMLKQLEISAGFALVL
jgi:Outer membrane protein beta-barrel domain